MSKRMKLEEVQDFLEKKVEGVVIDSFSGLNAILNTIPGIKTPRVIDDSEVPLTKEEEALKANLAVLATFFEGDPKSEPIKLHVQYPWTNSPVDYQIGFKLGKRFAPIASGLFSDIVKEVAT